MTYRPPQPLTTGVPWRCPGPIVPWPTPWTPWSNPRPERRTPDARLRQLARAVLEDGDPNAAEALLFEAARLGRFWVSARPGGNAKRAQWIRFLEYLRWPRAAEFRQVAASYAPRAYSAARISQLGPHVAEDIGDRILRPAATAAMRLVLPLTEPPTEAMRLPAEAPRAEAFRADVAAYEARIGAAVNHAHALQRTFEEAVAAAGRWHELLRRLRSSDDPLQHDEYSPLARPFKRTVEDFGQRGRLLLASAEPFAWRHLLWQHTVAEAAEALLDWSTAATSFHGSHKRFGEAIYHAEQALAWDCAARRRGALFSYRGRQRYQGERYGVAAGDLERGCVTIARRQIRQAMLPAALLAIAREVAKETAGVRSNPAGQPKARREAERQREGPWLRFGMRPNPGRPRPSSTRLDQELARLERRAHAGQASPDELQRLGVLYERAGLIPDESLWRPLWATPRSEELRRVLTELVKTPAGAGWDYRRELDYGLIDLDCHDPVTVGIVAEIDPDGDMPPYRGHVYFQRPIPGLGEPTQLAEQELEQVLEREAWGLAPGGTPDWADGLHEEERAAELRLRITWFPPHELTPKEAAAAIVGTRWADVVPVWPDE